MNKFAYTTKSCKTKPTFVCRTLLPTLSSSSSSTVDVVIVCFVSKIFYIVQGQPHVKKVFRKRALLCVCVSIWNGILYGNYLDYSPNHSDQHTTHNTTKAIIKMLHVVIMWDWHLRLSLLTDTNTPKHIIVHHIAPWLLQQFHSQSIHRRLYLRTGIAALPCWN